MGVDFGPTHSVVSAVDRGNYPIVAFTDTHGDMVDHFPSVVAVTDSGLVHGFEAVAAAEQGAPALRSMKRHLHRSPQPHGLDRDRTRDRRRPRGRISAHPAVGFAADADGGGLAHESRVDPVDGSIYKRSSSRAGSRLRAGKQQAALRGRDVGAE